MRTAAYFFLTLYTLLHTTHADSQCVIEPNAIVSDACISYSSLEELNREITPSLNEVTQQTDFFAYYRLNLYNKVCPFWKDEQSMCGNRACAVDTIEDEQDIPLIWRAEELSKLEGAHAQHPGPALQKKRPKQRPLNHQLGENVDESCVLEVDDECDERDYCVPEDEGATSKGDYVSLVNNTERFTGYSGPGARQVWEAIYKENCFGPESANLKGARSAVGNIPAAKELRNIFQEYGRQNVELVDDSFSLDDQCVEQRAFYRIISGMHASISSHLCWDYFNQTTGEWVRNLQCYQDRLHTHPERISNLYFNYALVSRAVAKIQKHLKSYTFCTGDPDQDYETKQKVVRLAGQIAATPHTFDESVMFRDPDMIDLKDDFKQRFRNVSRLMDCVGCDKCRLWGKVQTAGYGAAMKVLFEFDETKNGENPHLRRTELVALVNTLSRLSHSLNAVQKFRHAINTGDFAVLDAGINDAISAKESSLPASKQIISVTVNNNDEENDDDDNFDDDDDEWDPYSNKPPTYDNPTLSQAFKSEFDLVWRTYKMVLRSWINLPFKLSGIFVMEMNRLWNYWLGLPVPERSWGFHFPSRDEL